MPLTQLRRAFWLVPLAVLLSGCAQGQYARPVAVQTCSHCGQHSVQPCAVQNFGAPPVGSACGALGCATGCGSGSCCAPIIGPNTLSGWGGLWNWCNSKVANANCCGPVGHCGTFVHCQPKPPAILFPRVCGKGIADVCSLERFGYHNTCWGPWGYPPDFHHCPTPQLAASVPPRLPKTEYVAPEPLFQPQDSGEEKPEKPEKDPAPENGPESLPVPGRLKIRDRLPG